MPPAKKSAPIEEKTPEQIKEDIYRLILTALKERRRSAAELAEYIYTAGGGRYDVSPSALSSMLFLLDRNRYIMGIGDDDGVIYWHPAPKAFSGGSIAVTEIRHRQPVKRAPRPKKEKANAGTEVAGEINEEIGENKEKETGGDGIASAESNTTDDEETASVVEKTEEKKEIKEEEPDGVTAEDGEYVVPFVERRKDRRAKKDRRKRLNKAVVDAEGFVERRQEKRSRRERRGRRDRRESIDAQVVWAEGFVDRRKTDRRKGGRRAADGPEQAPLTPQQILDMRIAAVFGGSLLFEREASEKTGILTKRSKVVDDNKNGICKHPKNYYFTMIAGLLTALCAAVLSVVLAVLIPQRGFDFTLIIITLSLTGALIIVPWAVCFIAAKKAFSAIVFSAMGVEQVLFGKRMLFIMWEEVVLLEICPAVNFIFGGKDGRISAVISNKRRTLPDIIHICTNPAIREKLSNILTETANGKSN